VEGGGCVIEKIRQLLADGEGRTVEFKQSKTDLNKDLFESVCAFLNRDGGDLLLGVEDDGTVLGVERNCALKMKEGFATLANNPQKLSPPFYLSLQEVEYEGALLLHVYVPPSSQVHRSKNRIFDRNEDGDLDITDQQEAVAELYARKQSTYSENQLYPFARMEDLREDLIARARRLAVNRDPNHPWGELSNEDLLQTAQLWQRDLRSGESGYTLAAILLFGKDETILSAIPHHRTDAILRRVNVGRYDDRDDIRTNLLESRDRLFAFGEKHLPSPFQLEGNQRINVRDILLREIVGNLLIHREYSDAFPAKFVIESGRLFSENGNRPHGHGLIDPNAFSPFPKNPVIARVFKEIGWADELGSGVRNLYKYSVAFSGHEPRLMEDHRFRFELEMEVSKESSVATTPKTGETTPKTTPKTGETTPKTTPKTESTTPKTGDTTQDKVLRILSKHPATTRKELAALLGISVDGVIYHLTKLKHARKIEHIGPAKGGHWRVLQGGSGKNAKVGRR